MRFKILGNGTAPRTTNRPRRAAAQAPPVISRSKDVDPSNLPVAAKVGYVIVNKVLSASWTLDSPRQFG